MIHYHRGIVDSR